MEIVCSERLNLEASLLEIVFSTLRLLLLTPLVLLNVNVPEVYHLLQLCRAHDQYHVDEVCSEVDPDAEVVVPVAEAVHTVEALPQNSEIMLSDIHPVAEEADEVGADLLVECNMSCFKWGQLRALLYKRGRACNRPRIMHDGADRC